LSLTQSLSLCNYIIFWDVECPYYRDLDNGT
jgi:hypothetical protein